MKKIGFILTTFIGVLITFSLVLISCSKEKKLAFNGTFFNLCEGDTCYNNAVCYNGKCQCPAGYEGSKCLSTWNERYVANYEVNDNCDPNNNYIVSIVPKINQPSEIVISGLSKFCPSGVTTTIRGEIKTASTNLEFPMQLLCNDVYLSGTATQTTDKKYINMFLVARDSLAKTSKECSLVLRKL
jgi:hypothetical protein